MSEAAWLAEALRQAPDRMGWRAGMDADDYRELADWLIEHGVSNHRCEVCRGAFAPLEGPSSPPGVDYKNRG